MQYSSDLFGSSMNSIDPVWRQVRAEAEQAIAAEPALQGFYQGVILNHSSFQQSLAHILTQHLTTPQLEQQMLASLFCEALVADGNICHRLISDIQAYVDRDPACDQQIMPLLYFKGFQALQSYRIAHWLWNSDRKALASFIQNRASEVFDVDIHPAATIGGGIMIDHATEVVIGETSVVEDNVSMLHGVSLGGTGKSSGDRHPKIRQGVLIAAGAKILGNIEVGEGAKIGAGSLVLESVPAHTTVVGVPAVMVGRPKEAEPALEMDQRIDGGDSN